jgi:hypothetical protein
MAIQFRNASDNQTAASTSITFSKPTDTAENDILLCCIYANKDSPGPDISAPDGTWTSIDYEVYNTTRRWELFWKRAGASEGADYTFTMTSGTNLSLKGGIAAFSGVITSGTPYDQHSNNVYHTSDLLIIGSSITPTESLSLAVFISSGGNLLTGSSINNSFTERYDQGAAEFHLYVADRALTSTSSIGDTTQTSTGTASGNKHAFVLNLREPGSNIDVAVDVITPSLSVGTITVTTGDVSITQSVDLITPVLNYGFFARSAPGLLEPRDEFTSNTSARYAGTDGNTLTIGSGVATGTLNSFWVRTAFNNVKCVTARVKRLTNRASGVILTTSNTIGTPPNWDGYRFSISSTPAWIIYEFDDGTISATDYSSIASNLPSADSYGLIRIINDTSDSGNIFGTCGPTTFINMLDGVEATYNATYGGIYFNATETTPEIDWVEYRTSHEITCTGMPSGSYLRASDGTEIDEAQESGGTATISPSNQVWPLTSVQIRTASGGGGTLVAELTNTNYDDMGGGDALAYGAICAYVTTEDGAGGTPATIDVAPISLTADTPTSTRTNLMPSPSFEIDTDVDGLADDWEVGVGEIYGTLTKSIVSGRLGGSAQRIQYTANPSDSGADINLRAQPSSGVWGVPGFSPGDIVTVSFYAKGSLSGTTGTITVSAYNDAGSFISTVATISGWTPETDWSRKYLTTSALPALTAEVLFNVAFTVGSGDTIDVTFDDVLIEKSSILNPYFDGSSPGSSWAGTANASTSIARPEMAVVSTISLPSVTLTDDYLGGHEVLYWS